MNKKRVVSLKFPYLPLTIGIRKRLERVEALLDTGFDGDVVLPPGLITNGNPPDSYVRWKLADTSEVLVPAYLGRVEIADLGDAGTFAVVISILGDVPIMREAHDSCTNSSQHCRAASQANSDILMMRETCAEKRMKDTLKPLL